MNPRQLVDRSIKLRETTGAKDSPPYACGPVGETALQVPSSNAGPRERQQSSPYDVLFVEDPKTGTFNIRSKNDID